MRLSKKKRVTRSKMDMTPMIDVVFLLLIFFMTVSQVSKVDKLRVQLPELKGTEEQRTVELTINVRESGEIVAAGEVVDEAGLVTLLTQMLPQVKGNRDLFQVVVRADRRGDCKGVNTVIRSLAQLNIKRVRIAVQNQG